MFWLYIIILMIVICESGAMTCLQLFRREQNQMYFAGAILLYAIICYLLTKTYDYKGVSTVNAVWSGLSVMASTLVGLYIFHEDMGWKDFVGIGMVGAGVMMIKM